MSEVSSDEKKRNNAATNTGEAPRERGVGQPSRPMAPPKRGGVRKNMWEEFFGKPSSSNPPTDDRLTPPEQFHDDSATSLLM
ncbi:hypothetical protein SADUNF_Sadunf02G0064500 [Salix dunnii]|uniref:Uncharacterized protein n=1 Tax=Salix dunnii TaxID=1413687 RepID=A0A835N6C5_9ROSI|nr:hypothetical protein SADUNF_Sadunf02G0064500 [Salix dunnii]